MDKEGKVQKKLEFWKERLIDLSKKNKLLNFTTKDKISIETQDTQTLFNLLVESDKGQPIILIPKYIKDETHGKEILNSKSLKKNEYYVPLEQEKLEKILYRTRSYSRIALSEEGINILYLSFGFLKWYNEEHKETFLSPLILVPVKLEKDRMDAYYRIVLYDSEIEINPTLQSCLNTSDKIFIPSIDNEKHLDLAVYYNSIKNTSPSDEGWEIIEDVCLSKFSFAKFIMYKDIERNMDIACDHDIIRKLAGVNSQPVTSSTKESPQLDEIPDSNVYHILDADSSQWEAIEAAKNDISFVLHGPPGTGKSQTIANIIAELINKEKKVLFVSEKMAALEVVYNRLKECGLDDFCLEIHSNKANKKIVYDDINNSLLKCREYKNIRILSDIIYLINVVCLQGNVS